MNRNTSIALAALFFLSYHDTLAFTVQPRYQTRPPSFVRSWNRPLSSSTRDTTFRLYSSLKTEEEVKESLAPPPEIPSFFEKQEETTITTTNTVVSSSTLRKNSTEKKESNLPELIGLGIWMASLSAFLLINNFVGPFPANILSVPEKTWPVMHGVAGMLFGGGIILTTCIEWLVTESKNSNVLQFWFGKVPALDSLIVLPALTAAIVSGTALSIDHYDSLGQAPFHVVAAISTLAAAAGWWAITDLTTQSRATKAVEEWTDNQDVPGILQFRKFSNVVSCGFVAALYAIMIIKPGL